MHKKPYNPLDYDNLTINLVRELMGREAVLLPLPQKFDGPGVYALFYHGSFGPYSAFCSPEALAPIYVGKAVPPGARKGGGEVNENAPTLYQRIRQHVGSIDAAKNLSIADFSCRYLTVVPLWITMAERFLIEHYRPLWNVCIEGFGIHDPGKGRHAGEISWWDTLHPGRPWVKKLLQTKSTEDAIERIDRFMAKENINQEIP